MLKIYGSLQCPDCVRCVQEMESACVSFEFLAISDNLWNLKAFLKLRDSEPAFDTVRREGKIGIPCIQRPDGSVTLSWEEFLV